MKLPFNCHRCFFDNPDMAMSSTLFVFRDLEDNGIYPLTCPQGHKQITVIQQQKFELLFDIATMAILDGYYREAVTSMAAAMERLYEFYVRVICSAKGITDQVFAETWKPVGKLSERQLGAFVFVHLLAENSSPPLIHSLKPTIAGRPLHATKTWAEFRNETVHNGYIPSIEETMAYGTMVFHQMRGLTELLTTKYGDATGREVFKHLFKAKKEGDDTPVSTLALPTIISLTHTADQAKTLEEALTQKNAHSFYRGGR